jgi:hypothetical protein
MPPILGIAGLLPALIGAGVTGVTTGLEASGAIGGGGGPSQATQQQEQLTQQEAAQKQQQQQLQQTFKSFAPDAQAQTGGSLSDSSFASLVAELAGQPGNIGTAQQTIFGSTPESGLGAS